jgi:hypothetical protein
MRLEFAQNSYKNTSWSNCMNSFWLCIRIAVALAAVVISGCATRTEFASSMTLPTNQAWVENRKVEYITTDISDQAMAHGTSANYVPRLRDAVGTQKSVLERVYKFPNDEQISVFQSAPSPIGSANLDKSYSPLWRMVMVTWLVPRKFKELRSEEEILSAQDQGLIELKVTDIVVNCPIVR